METIFSVAEVPLDSSLMPRSNNISIKIKSTPLTPCTEGSSVPFPFIPVQCPSCSDWGAPCSPGRSPPEQSHSSCLLTFRVLHFLGTGSLVLLPQRWSTGELHVGIQCTVCILGPCLLFHPGDLAGPSVPISSDSRSRPE